jgi:aspartyl-tRNA(Asn)/glutamyl-tRNA(Gln) amidotransferase subunit C
MEVNKALVDNLAQLARLQFNEQETAAVGKDLEKMIAFVEDLNKLDTTGVDPLLHISEAYNSLREDRVKGSVSREEALLNAPGNDGTYFKVPKVIDAAVLRDSEN